MTKKTLVDIGGTRVELSNLEKIFYPLVGFTKAQVIDYYARIAPVLLPHLAHRPISLKRYPDGVTGGYFFQKQSPPYRPDWIETVPVTTGRRQIDYCLINDLQSLVWAANLANLELHTFLHQAPEIQKPTILAFDLDPGEGVDILLCAEVGLWIRDLLKDLGVSCFPKTSGSKGLQLYVPLNSPADYESTKGFALKIAQYLAGEHPDKIVTKMKKELRVGKVLVDWSQNDEHKTTVSVYSLRATDRPTVSTPVTWEEISEALRRKDPTRLVFEAQEVLDRVKGRGDLFASVLTLQQQLPSLESLDAKRGRATAPPAVRLGGSAAADCGRGSAALQTPGGGASPTRHVPGEIVPGRNQSRRPRSCEASARPIEKVEPTTSMHRGDRPAIALATSGKADPTGTAGIGTGSRKPTASASRTKGGRPGEAKADLQTYREKRKFDSTAEPEGKLQAGEELSFVVQKHRARNLHYDLRLAMGGVLKSWAVPRGPSLDRAVRRLAVMVEDHPLEYVSFEGVIPKGNYGAGEMIVWDRGTYRTEGDPLAQLEQGKLVFELNGKKLHGEFHLVKTRSSKGNEWLLIKGKDQWVSKEDILGQDRSVLTGKRIEEYRNSTSQPTASPDLSFLDFQKLRPMLAKSADEPFDDPDWIFELKFDGYRALALVDHETVRLASRRGTDLSGDYPVIVDALVRMGICAVLDGEIVVVDEAGVPKFELLQSYKTARKGNLVFYVFDILFFNGRDVRDQPLRERKEILQFALSPSETVRYTDHVDETGVEFFNLVKKSELEGIIAKQKSGRYLSGKRADHWLKIKCRPAQKAIICGYTESRANKGELGALLLGVREHAELKFAGRVGTGLNRVPDLLPRLQKLSTQTLPFKMLPETDMPIHWVKPELVCSVEFHGWTRAGLMREPSFVSLSTDL